VDLLKDIDIRNAANKILLLVDYYLQWRSVSCVMLSGSCVMLSGSCVRLAKKFGM
jgi:hypothetical protein